MLCNYYRDPNLVAVETGDGGFEIEERPQREGQCYRGERGGNVPPKRETRAATGKQHSQPTIPPLSISSFPSTIMYTYLKEETNNSCTSSMRN